jgi:hypothetical protein
MAAGRNVNIGDNFHSIDGRVNRSFSQFGDKRPRLPFQRSVRTLRGDRAPWRKRDIDRIYRPGWGKAVSGRLMNFSNAAKWVPLGAWSPEITL